MLLIRIWCQYPHFGTVSLTSAHLRTTSPAREQTVSAAKARASFSSKYRGQAVGSGAGVMVLYAGEIVLYLPPLPLEGGLYTL